MVSEVAEAEEALFFQDSHLAANNGAEEHLLNRPSDSHLSQLAGEPIE